MDKPINSHVQIPKTILEEFSFREIEFNKNNQPVPIDFVYCLGLDCKAITKENIKTLNTIEGYYSSEMETFLSIIEGQTGEIKKEAKRFYNNNISQYNINQDMVKNFARFAFLRSKLTLNEANRPTNASYILNILGYNTNKSQEDLLMHPEALQGAFDNYDVTVFENHSKVDLVVPRNCIYNSEFICGNVVWVMPFSPRLAFILVNKQDSCHNEKGSVPNSGEDEFIRIMNRHALECEIKMNNCFIVAKREQELEELLPVILKIHAL